MVELANMRRFPERERHENAQKWLPRAQAAVADLKTYPAAYEDLIGERERLDAEQAAYTQQVELQWRFARSSTARQSPMRAARGAATRRLA